ncbi:MAG: histidine kinase [Bryobacterales bacterium]|nr:histidine kinase [Bryobacterales bacterium]
MHPFLKNKAQFAVYLALWLPLVVVFALLLQSQPSAWAMRDALGFALLAVTLLAFLFLSMYYVCRALPLRETSPGKIAGVHAVGVTTASAVWFAFALLFAWLMDRGFARGTSLEARGSYFEQVWRDLPVLAVFSVVMLTLGVAVGYLLIALESQRETEGHRQQMQTLAREAELRSLRAQINPHFLFNSLNSISALTTQNPERAREMCLLLSEFFRRNLDIGNQESTTLGEELDLVFNYLQIEMARFGKRLQVDADVPDDLRGFVLPPLLLQPLVENAVKHGIAGLVEGGKIGIRARSLSGGGLSLSIENPFDPEQPRRRRRGIGLENVRGRLDFRYGRDARFEVTREEARFRAKIQIAARGEAAGAPAQNPVPEASSQ